MKNGVCPKCGGNEIIHIPGHVSTYGGGNTNRIAITYFNAVNVTRYVCCSCGFSEEWIDYREEVEKLKKKYGSHIHKKKE